MTNFITGFLIILNIFSFFVVGYDKYKAKNKGWRVAEKNLFTLAFLGGAIGIYLGMKVFRHKTKHVSFTYGIPLLIVSNVLIYFFLWRLTV